MKNISVVYTHAPHYRQPVFDKLLSSNSYKFTIYTEIVGHDKTIKDIKDNRYVNLKSFRIGNFHFQYGRCIIDLLKSDLVIFLGNPYVVSTWIYTLFLRFFGVKVLFWTHGWINSKENSIKTIFRNGFYKISNGLLLYGERAKTLGIKYGFEERNLHVIYNSLNYNQQLILRRSLSDLKRIKNRILCVGRLVEALGCSDLIKACDEYYNIYGVRLELIIVGDGPLKTSLQTLALELSVNATFTGAIYSEENLAELFITSSTVVSPGKIGLLAMHALVYSTPVVTHNDVDSQMPEFEALQESDLLTCYEKNNMKSLACAINESLQIESSKLSKSILYKFNPHSQEKCITNAIKHYV